MSDTSKIIKWAVVAGVVLIAAHMFKSRRRNTLINALPSVDDVDSWFGSGGLSSSTESNKKIGSRILERLKKDKSLQMEVVISFSELKGDSAKMETALITKDRNGEIQMNTNDKEVDLTKFDFEKYYRELGNFFKDAK